MLLISTNISQKAEMRMMMRARYSPKMSQKSGHLQTDHRLACRMIADELDMSKETVGTFLCSTLASKLML
jgi:hypothetical protein